MVFAQQAIYYVRTEMRQILLFTCAVSNKSIINGTISILIFLMF